ncbi:MAG: pyruvate ferredoxin oxidoreductase [Pseudomonadota bacterium]|jgi:pyruvate/2-oxoacid:ferredoxin oxidoreductase alpha subunit|nr:pyruvate ferredoxin oxidoreductase [Syntrophaceae bacterium]MDI9555747.1 pyruvate ferredoxin oxidoreductase [Pseudomonadota bacterium]NLX32135.1 pyruvate ferredoxin oxidoreductase [Deltaproteobacteria bacterium]HNU85505.1 pyruvate ferredoxin oxidoreductase [Syntrophales bacterium]HNZ34311.1 pyruvate ferredoxin oxidoreductase [Syntrophales bacterium]
MKRVLEGSQAVAEAVRLARVQVVSAYPITPQTHIVEFLSEYCASGTMNARFLRVESEHSCMAALIGAQSAGVRTFTATSGQGLALMHELLHWAAGARLPIVMAEVNRALAPGWNIWVDQTDSLAQRDTGWIQFYCEDGQEVIDTTLQAYRLAESVALPAMVVLDAFFLSHTYEPVDVPEQEEADRFLPPYEARFQLDTAAPCSFGPLVPPAVYMEMRHDIAKAMETALSRFPGIENEYAAVFGRRYGVVEAIRCEDAEIVFVTSGTVTSTARSLLENLRSRGERLGILKIRLFRPFPVEAVRRALGGAAKVAVIDRNFSFGASGIFAQEVRAALCNAPGHPPVFGFVAGIGGRDVTPELLEEIYWKTKNSDAPEKESVWIGLQEV